MSIKTKYFTGFRRIEPDAATDIFFTAVTLQINNTFDLSRVPKDRTFLY